MPFPKLLCNGIRWGGVGDSGFSSSTLVKEVEIFSVDPSGGGDLCPLRAQDTLMEESEQQSAVLQEIVSGADAVLNIDMSSIFRATCSHFDVEFVGWFIHSQIPLLLDFEMMFQQQFWKAETLVTGLNCVSQSVHNMWLLHTKVFHGQLRDTISPCVLGLPQGLLLDGHAQNISPERCPRGILTRHLN